MFPFGWFFCTYSCINAVETSDVSRLWGSQVHCNCAPNTQVMPPFETLKPNVSWKHGQLLPLSQVAGENAHENQSAIDFCSSPTGNKPILRWHWQLFPCNLLIKGWADWAINEGGQMSKRKGQSLYNALFPHPWWNGPAKCGFTSNKY